MVSTACFGPRSTLQVVPETLRAMSSRRGFSLASYSFFTLLTSHCSALGTHVGTGESAGTTWPAPDPPAPPWSAEPGSLPGSPFLPVPELAPGPGPGLAPVPPPPVPPPPEPDPPRPPGA